MIRSDASRVIWDWQRNKGGQHHAAKPSRRTASIGLLVGGAVAAFFFAYGHIIMMAVVLTISLTIFSCAMFFPKAYQTIQLVLQKFSFIVGQVLTWLLLTPFFYLAFSLGRFVQKISKRDPMTREWEPHRETYWVKRPAIADKEQYKRQF